MQPIPCSCRSKDAPLPSISRSSDGKPLTGAAEAQNGPVVTRAGEGAPGRRMRARLFDIAENWSEIGGYPGAGRSLAAPRLHAGAGLGGFAGFFLLGCCRISGVDQ